MLLTSVVDVDSFGSMMRAMIFSQDCSEMAFHLGVSFLNYIIFKPLSIVSLLKITGVNFQIFCWGLNSIRRYLSLAVIVSKPDKNSGI